MRGKKGAEPMPLSYIIGGLILVVLAGIVIYYGIYKPAQAITTSVQIIPGLLEQVTQGCKLNFNAELKASYCAEFKKVGTKGALDAYANCESSSIVFEGKTSLPSDYCLAEQSGMVDKCKESVVSGGSKGIAINGVEFKTESDCDSKIANGKIA